MNDKVAEWRDIDMPDAVVTSVWITKQGSVQSPLVDQSIYIQFCIVNWLSKNYGGSIMFCQRIELCYYSVHQYIRTTCLTYKSQIWKTVYLLKTVVG